MRVLTLAAVLVLASLTAGCAAARGPMRVEMAPMALEEARQPSAPQILTQNHFSRDTVGSITEAALQKVLEAPVFLEENARVGVVPVAGSYALETDVPLPGVPAALADALDTSGQFELACEISTDFPADRGISGLRELAARYRADYLLIYRHRFVDRDYLNPWAWGYVTGIGALFLPGQTIETAGVLEATLFDVKTGTILFTVHERVGATEQVNNWHTDLKKQWLQRKLLERATDRLADQVLAKVQRLVAARNNLGSPGVAASPRATELDPLVVATPQVQ